MVKPRNNNNRRRNRRSGGGNGNNFESNGPSIKVRGSSKQIYEKYLSLARDARSSGDAVLQESYSQHAEHYARLLIESGKFENNDNTSNNKPSNEVKSDDQTKVHKASESYTCKSSQRNSKFYIRRTISFCQTGPRS